MTVLVLKNEEDKIILAADTGVFWGFSGMKENNSTKIITVKENLIFASTGSVSEHTLFEIFLLKNEPETNCRQAILRLFSDFVCWKKQFTDKLEQNNAYFLVYNKKPYLINFNFDVQEIGVSEFKTLGAGMQEAKCALYLGKTPKEAVDITKELNCWASGDTQVVEIDK